MKKSNPTPHSPTIKPAKIQIIIWFLLLAIMIALSLRDFSSFQVGAYLDDAKYLLLAKTLCSSEQYGLHNSPGEVQQAPYPIGYPLILAPFLKIDPNNLDLAKIPSLISTCLNAALLFWGWRKISMRSYWWGLAIAGLYMFSPRTIDHTRMIMAEPVFTTFCLLAFIHAPGIGKVQQNRLWFFAISMTLVMVLLIRTVGLALIAAVMLYFLIKGGHIWKRVMVITALMTAFFVAIIAFTDLGIQDLIPFRYVSEWRVSAKFQPANQIVENPVNTLDVDRQFRIEKRSNISERTILGNITKLVSKNSISLLDSLRIMIVPVGGGETEERIAKRLGAPFMPAVLRVLVTGVTLLGLGRWLLKERNQLPALYVISYITLLVLWNWIEIRLMYPLQPLLMFSFLLGVHAVLKTTIQWVTQTQHTRFTGGLLILMVLFLAAASIFSSLRLENSRDHTGDLEDRTRWIKENSDETAVLMTEAATVDYLYSNRKTIQFNGIFHAADPVEFLRSNQVDLILIAPHIYWREVYTPNTSQLAKNLLLLLEKEPLKSQVELVYSSREENIRVYQTRPSQPALP